MSGTIFEIEGRARAVSNYLEYHYTLEKLSESDQIVATFQEEHCTVQSLIENGVRSMWAFYNAPKSDDCIHRLRYTQFIQLTNLNKSMQLSNLPSMSAAAHNI